MNEDTLINAFIVIMGGTVFSGVGVLIFLIIKSFNLTPSSNGLGSHVFRFFFSVSSGVVTYIITDTLFGHGTDKSTATAIVTAAMIGVATKFIGGNSDVGWVIQDYIDVKSKCNLE